MNYQVVARKFRPGQFKEVIGQEHITQTIKNAIKANRIAHAYLFSGPRGVGKTTTARLLAKALNCADGPTDSPCGVCQDCKEISEGVSMNVLEVDGASNNGVDQVRSLTDTIKYNTASEKYKIYIIDEVHMLTIAAFNALLKNLEEPPSRVVFIFATTEIHKVPETIQSRCQQFIFTLIPYPVIIERLKKIVTHESYQAEEKAFDIIARASGGSMRDAESVLEKVMTFCGEVITEAKALEALGLVERKMFFDLADSILGENTPSCFKIVEQVANEGRNLDKFIRESIHFFRNILFCLLTGELPEVFFEEISKKKLNEYAEQFSETQLVFILDTLCELEATLKHSLSPKTVIEIAFVKISHSRNILPISKVIQKLSWIEERLSGVRQNQAAIIKEAEMPSDLSLEGIKKEWTPFMMHLKMKNPVLFQYMGEAKVATLNEERLTLEFPESSVFHAKILNDPGLFNQLGTELSAFFNRHFQVQIEIDTTLPVSKGMESGNGGNDTGPQINEFVSDALEAIEGSIMDVKRNYNKGERK